MNISQYQSNSQDWSDQDWEKLLAELIASGLVSHKEVTSLVLGHLNPPQVGTSIASKENFKNQFPPRKCWEAVRKWHFNQMGRCADCGTRFELQADHIIPKQQLGNNADKLENLTFRCRRCNVIKRPSHTQGGLTDLTAEAALMWLLFTKQPNTYQQFAHLCRNYGMTMADIRFQEAWAMAKWLEREGKYFIDNQSKY
ncbi:MAG: HNH endonuclease [Dolichospermum sp. DEX182a]|nr:HNH endonuclease [Dolichospermum sp. DEX182a]